MNQTQSIQGVVSKKEAEEQIKLQFDQYLEQQPQSTQTAHQWILRLEAVCLGLVIALFIAAMYVSIMWKTVPVLIIPAAWVSFAISTALTSGLLGLHFIVLRASPQTFLPGQNALAVTGKRAVWTGIGLVLASLFWIVFCGFVFYSISTFNLSFVEPLARVASTTLGIMITAKILYSIFKAVTRTR